MDIKIRECQLQSGRKHGQKRAKFMEIMNSRKTVDVFERLPIEILHDIIVRLPITSISRLRYTSKLWYARLMDPKLADSQLSHAMEDPGYFCASFNRNSYFLEEVSSEMKATKVCRKTFGECISSGGLIAYAIFPEGNPFYICNPLIGEEVRVPNCLPLEQVEVWAYPPIDPKYIVTKRVNWGFGYSLSTKEYKIVRHDAIWPTGKGETIHRCAIYTLGSDSWRDISSHVPLIPFGRPAECKGTIFWLVHKRIVILAFDVGSEKFHSLPGPNSDAVNGLSWGISVLLNVGETVAFVLRCGSKFRIWKLRDKDNGIWMNEYIVSYSFIGTCVADLVGVWKKDYLFGCTYDARKFVYYDDESKQFRELKPVAFKDLETDHNILPRFLHVVPHAGGLISPLGIVANAMKKKSISK